MGTFIPVLSRTIEATVNEIAAGLVAAVPRLVGGLVFFTAAYVGIRLVIAGVREGLERVYAEQQRLVVHLFVTVVRVFLWFAAGLALLKVLGMGDIAASLGTSAGFVALGVSYALSNMIADTVAGVYLLRDPDFAPGDTVTAESVTGTVTSIELRKTRFRLDNGDVVILANRDIEKKWTKKPASAPAES